MAYKVTVYFNDADIASTNIYGYKTDEPMGWVDSDFSYGQSAISANFSGTIKFEATPADGCEFTQWVYRTIKEGEKEENAEQKYSYNNPFSYSGNDEIIIRAEGQKTSGGKWIQKELSFNGYVDEDFNLTKTLSTYTAIRYNCVTYLASGQATIRASSSAQIVGYIAPLDTKINYANGVPTTYIAMDDGGKGYGFELTFDVTANVTYALFIKGETGTETGDIVIYFSPPNSGEEEPTIDEWDWYSSNGSATASQTSKAHTAVTSKGYTTNFSYKVWNDMVDKVKEICDEAVGWWDTGYATYTNTKMSGSNEQLTAKMFNSLRNNLENAGANFLSIGKISDGYTSGKIPHPVYSFDDNTVTNESLKIVYGHYFTTLTDYMNDCIRYL